MNTNNHVKQIWIDTDIIFNQPGGEVDDGLALMMALHHPRAELIGISLIHSVDNGYVATQKLLEYYAKTPIPVYKGADDAAQGPGTCTEAVDQLAQALCQQQLSIAAIGPATNIANLLEFYPEAAKNITELVFCAGRQKGVSFTAPGSPVVFPDYNFDLDPESMRRVIASDIPVTLSGYEASSSVFLYQEDLEQIKHNGREGDSWVYQQLEPWITLWQQQLNIEGFIPFDTCTLGHLLYPDQFEYHRRIPVHEQVRANDARAFLDVVEKPYLEVSYDFASSNQVDFAYQAKPGYKHIVMQHLLGKTVP